jgi:hypothetical protein
MLCLALALDYDGTTAIDGKLSGGSCSGNRASAHIRTARRAGNWPACS